MSLLWYGARRVVRRVLWLFEKTNILLYEKRLSHCGRNIWTVETLSVPRAAHARAEMLQVIGICYFTVILLLPVRVRVQDQAFSFAAVHNIAGTARTAEAQDHRDRRPDRTHIDHKLPRGNNMSTPCPELSNTFRILK